MKIKRQVRKKNELMGIYVYYNLSLSPCC